MFSRFKQFFHVPTLDAMNGRMTKTALYNTNQDGPHDHFEINPPRTLSQQLIDDLAELRKNTTIVGRNPAEESLCRLMRPIFEPSASLSWPPAPHKADSHPDRYSEELSSPSVSFTSRRSGYSNERSSVVESPELLRSPPRFYVEPYRSSFFQSQSLAPALAPVRRIIPHIIGEDDPCNPFSYNLDFDLQDKNERNVDTPNGMIFAPVPQLPTAAALANFEATAAMVSTMEGVVEKEPTVSQHDSVAGPSLSSSKETYHVD